MKKEKTFFSRLGVSLGLICHVLLWRIRYKKTLRHIKGIRGCRPLRVAFLVSECAKWKVQTLYDQMVRNQYYEPFVVLTHADFDFGLTEEERTERRLSNVRFFKDRGIRYEETVKPDLKFANHLCDLHPDIVFYQHPYTHLKEEMPGEVAKYALTCYVPYYIPNYGSIANDSQLLLHRQLWCYFCQTKTLAQAFTAAKPWFKRSTIFVGSGHPMLDCYHLNDDPIDEHPYVIYAPHWAFSYPGHDNFENFSTFPQNGKLILEYALKHPEIKWAFKPHPTLKAMLKRSKLMSDDEIDSYYKAWERIGEACYDGNYVSLFMRSRAMITDCASFLSEYPCTGMPLIHLRAPNPRLGVLKECVGRLFDVFYQVHDEQEMLHWFDEILVQGKDPRKEERLAAVAELGLIGTNAASATMDFLNKVLKINTKETVN